MIWMRYLLYDAEDCLKGGKEQEGEQGRYSFAMG